MRVKHPQINDVGVWRHAEICRISNATVAGCDRSDVRAVTIGIIDAILAGKVTAKNDATSGTFVQERNVINIHTGIQNSDSDSGSVKSCGGREKSGSYSLPSYRIRASSCRDMPERLNSAVQR